MFQTRLQYFVVPVLMVAMGAVWFIKPASLWEAVFHVNLWKQNKETFALTDVTPFTWDKVCMADRSYYDDEAYNTLNEQVGVRGFDSRQLSINGDEQGGYLLFIQKGQVIPLEWNSFGGFGIGAVQQTACWDKALMIKRGLLDGKTTYLPI